MLSEKSFLLFWSRKSYFDGLLDFVLTPLNGEGVLHRVVVVRKTNFRSSPLVRLTSGHWKLHRELIFHRRRLEIREIALPGGNPPLGQALVLDVVRSLLLCQILWSEFQINFRDGHEAVGRHDHRLIVVFAGVAFWKNLFCEFCGQMWKIKLFVS